jgi:hypothetical protein
MKAALVSTQTAGLFRTLEAAFTQAGFAVSAAASQEEILDMLRQGEPAVLIRETPRTAFATLMRASFGLRPAMPVYLIDGGAVFCRYPFASRQPDIVRTLRTAGIVVSERLTWGDPQDSGAGGKPEGAPTNDQGDDAFLV